MAVSEPLCFTGAGLGLGLGAGAWPAFPCLGSTPLRPHPAPDSSHHWARCVERMREIVRES